MGLPSTPASSNYFPDFTKDISLCLYTSYLYHKPRLPQLVTPFTMAYDLPRPQSFPDRHFPKAFPQTPTDPVLPNNVFNSDAQCTFSHLNISTDANEAGCTWDISLAGAASLPWHYSFCHYL